MKRAAPEGDSGGDSKKAAGGAPGGGIGNKGIASGEKKVEPIPRPLRENEITLHFNQVTWEEIGQGQLKYLPLCQTPYYMMDPGSLKLLNKYKGLWSTAEYHTPRVRIYDLMLLQDELTNQGGTPLETTAFTQACYMVEFEPIGQTQFFHLSTMQMCNGTVKSLFYDLSDVTCDANDVSQLITLTNYEDMEKLCLHTAKVNIYGGFDPYEKLQRNMTEEITYLENVYIPPNDIDIGQLAAYAGNLQPGSLTSKIVGAYDQVTFARNMGKLRLHAYNDSFELPIITNIEGKKLLPIRENDFTNRSIKFSRSGMEYNYNTEFCWPSSNRPYYSRSSNLTQYSPLLDPKSLKPLKHYFFSMPPIRKANGALLKQRASFMMEQSFSVTFRFPESVWEDEDFQGHSTQKFLLDQKDAIIIRPNVYGTLKKSVKKENFICPVGTTINCKPDAHKCFGDDTVDALMDIMVDAKLQTTLWTWSWAPEGIEIDDKIDVICTLAEDPPGMIFRPSDFRTPEFKTAWQAWLAKSKDSTIGASTIYIQSKSKLQWRRVEMQGGTSVVRFENPFEWGSGNGRMFYLLMGDYVKLLDWAGITCVPTHAPEGEVQNADTPLFPVSREATVFFC